ncbi:hypothetical protein KW850_31040 [Bacillus sp. sid0103]|uniref:hypothetical protein n=1 Tax=Bacillus sp. sid0103 TaxID=2856337 RepID=UPI001C4597A3|nr:hypothetical protein [Bacillus sp. sid0103]MBV7509570.1 hypothetical protein [Bacillus sp. sid0103]
MVAFLQLKRLETFTLKEQTPYNKEWEETKENLQVLVVEGAKIATSIDTGVPYHIT